MNIIQRKRRGGEESKRWWVFAGVGSGERTRYISIFSDFIQRLHAIIFFPITIQEQYAKRWSKLISGREMKGKVFEAVLICPCWCCFCILPTPDGYRSKVGANQGFPQTHMEIDTASESSAVLSQKYSFPSSFMYSNRVTHTWNIHDGLNSARSHRRTFMKQLFWFRWETSGIILLRFQRLFVENMLT